MKEPIDQPIFEIKPHGDLWNTSGLVLSDDPRPRRVRSRQKSSKAKRARKASRASRRKNR